jgi:transcriptional regulator with XRE-family HTH domain
MPSTKTPLTTSSARDIRKRREARGLSQQGLADKVGVKRAQIKRLEAVEVDSVDSKLLERIARALGGAGKSPRTRATSRTRTRATSRTRTRAPRKRPVGAGAPRSKKAMKKLLEQSGLLDLTLRELLG